MAENFPKLMTDTKPPIWETQRTPNKINVRKRKLYLNIPYSNR